jgi:hypothetical protein
VFISFSHRRDGEYVQRLAAFLTEAGVPAWFDQKIPTGDRWATVIRDHIDTCAALIVVMTPEAEKSDWVSREIEHAEKKGKPILPLLLRGKPFFSLANIQYEAVVDGAMPGPEFVRRLSDLVSAVNVTATGAVTRDTGNGPGIQAPPHGIAALRGAIPLAAGPRSRRGRWLVCRPGRGCPRGDRSAILNQLQPRYRHKIRSPTSLQPIRHVPSDAHRHPHRPLRPSECGGV